MIEKIFAVVTRFANKHNLRNTAIGERLVPIYQRFQWFTMSRAPFVPGSVLAEAQRNSYLAENAERIERVAATLADEKSKNTYLGLTKYRQTGLKKDFPAKYYSRKKYLVRELRFGKDEVFIDCGAFNGNTIDDFIKHCGEYRAVIAFEPDLRNFQKLKKKYGENNPKITLINAGVYDKDGEVKFNTCGSDESKIISDDGPENCATAIKGEINSIQVKSIDNLNLQDKVTFIKMDVEGAELDALKGAKNTILRDKPKLAISIYHSNEDMICIAEYIHKIMPEYKLYVQQHMLFPSCGETVLYATIPA
ncbi:MAG: FkbM family methyltransferase [Chitinispirillales bacterium]|jgi:FkbM family methyltransferase|nr:FkbM family methyltransferase [Chitinispirillales bacterium]